MGQDDHEETADSPHSLDPGLDSGLDLEYLHLTGPQHRAPDMEEETKTSEEDREEEEEERGDGSGRQGNGDEGGGQQCRTETGLNQAKPAHQPLCRTQCVDLGSEGPPDLLPCPENPPQSPAKPPENVPQSPAKPPENPPQSPAKPPENVPQSPAKPPENVPQSPAKPPENVPQSPAKPPENVPQSPAKPPENVPQSPAKPPENVPQSPAKPPENVPQSPVKPPENVPQSPAKPPENAPQSPAKPPENAPQSPAKPPENAPQSPAKPPENVPQSPAKPPENVPQSPAKPPENVPQSPAKPPENVPQSPAKPPENVPQSPAKPPENAPQSPAKPPENVPQSPAKPPENAPQSPAKPPENVPQSPAKPPANAPQCPPDDGSKDYQAKLDFALKLGYSEEVVRAVLTKLGAETLINDVLGELVRLGGKAEPQQGPGVGLGAAVGASGSCGCTDEGRADSPALSESLGDQENLRPIVVDGSNVAMSHGNKEVFSCQGIQLAVDWFLERGHHDITVFVPAWRKEQSRPDAPITDQEILRRLEKQKVLVFTPSRRVQGRRVVCYDDRFIVKLAFESDGIIVSNDNYRDLANEKPEWKRFIDERLLMYSFVNDKFMPPDDPLGRHGPSLDNFLRKRPVIPEQKKQPCPYGKKCTYGHKCKYYHPERGAQPQRAVADELRASAKTGLTPKQPKAQTKAQTDPGLVKSHSVPAGEAPRSGPKRQSDPSVRALSYSDAEERLLLKGLSGNSSALQKCGSRTMSPAPGGPPSLPQDELSRSGTQHGHAPEPPYPLCHSPEYYCVSRAYSNLSLSSSCRPPQEPRPAPYDDLRLGSAGSECGSESSSCDSCPPESLADDFHYPHAARFYAHPHDFCGGHPSVDYPFPPHPDAPPKRPLYPLPAHMQHPPLSARSSCPADYPHHHRPPPRHHSPGSLAESASDSRLYEHFSHHPPHRPKVLPHWETYYRPPLATSRYEASSCYWDSYGSPTHYPPPPSYPYPPRPDSPAHAARYSDVREKVYVNLCNIFPPELVGRVMARSPHVTDAQQLAAAILAEKAQTGY